MTASTPDFKSERAQAFHAATLADYDLEIDHMELLTQICRTIDRIEELSTLLDEHGPTTLTAHGEIKASPLLTAERQASETLSKLLRVLDLEGTPDPLARKR